MTNTFKQNANIILCQGNDKLSELLLRRFVLLSIHHNEQTI
jgi:hypothetical protein